MSLLTNIVLVGMILLVFNFIIFFVGLKRNNFKKDSSMNEVRRYYYGNKGRIRYTKKYDYSMLIFDEFWLLYGYIFILFSIYNLVLVIYVNIPNIWIGTGKYIDEIPQLMINTFLGVFAVIGIATAINKKHFITFTIIDIFASYKIRNKIFNMILLICSTNIIFYVSVIMKNMNIQKYYFSFKSLIFINFILFLYFALRTCWIAGSICTSNPRFELKGLNHLYENFWYTDIKMDTDKWDIAGVEHNMEYLLQSYKETLKKISLSKLENVKFVSILEVNDELKFLQYRAVIWYYSFFCFMFSFFSLSMQFHFSLIISIFIICIIMCMVTYSIRSLRIITTIIVYDRCGYVIQYDTGKLKYKRTISTPISKWMKYIHSIQNILAFYKIAINKTENEEAEKAIIKYIMSNMQGEDDLDILMALILYIKYEKVGNTSELNEMYKGILTKGFGKVIINREGIAYQMMNAILSDINRDIKFKNDSKIELRNPKLYEFSTELKCYNNKKVN